MKHLIFLLAWMAMWIVPITSKGQDIITKNDSIFLGQDTVVKITLPKLRGQISWEQSFDKDNWISSSLIDPDTLTVPVTYSAFYRAKIVDGTCNPIYSDTVKVEICDTINTVDSKSILEVAYPDSVGENVKVIFNNRVISCTKINNEYVYQGDIILADEQIQQDTSLKGAGIPLGVGYNLWPENIVYYIVDDKLKDDTRIKKAINHWETYTPIRFQVRTDEYCYVKFVWDADGCSSSLGMIIKDFPFIGVPQKIRIADWAVTGNVIHEIGHTVGLIHEQSRSDRDSFITVFLENIQENYQEQYDIWENSINTSSFDFGSIMLYSSSGFAINSEVYTMINNSTGLPFDCQRSYLSPNDIRIVKKLYPPIQQSNTFTDSRDGKTYKWVKIGNQVWMAENLAYLPSVSPPTRESNTNPYYYIYGYYGTSVSEAKATANYSTYGVLYNWPAAMAGAGSSNSNPSGVKGVCPAGWHLPSDAEWKQLENYLIANGYNYDGTTTGNKIAKSMAATKLWDSSSNEGAVGNNLSLNNKSGFSALPAGARGVNGTFVNIGTFGNWWNSTSTEYPNNAWVPWMNYNDIDVVHMSAGPYEMGNSVRCVRD